MMECFKKTIRIVFFSLVATTCFISSNVSSKTRKRTNKLSVAETKHNHSDFNNSNKIDPFKTPTTSPLTPLTTGFHEQDPLLFQIDSHLQPYGDNRCVCYAAFNLEQIIKGLENGKDVTKKNFITSQQTTNDFENWLKRIKEKWQKKHPTIPFKDEGNLNGKEVWMLLSLFLPEKYFKKTSFIYEDKNGKTYDVNQVQLKIRDLEPLFFIFSISIGTINHAITYVVINKNTIVGCDSSNIDMLDRDIVQDVYNYIFYSSPPFAHNVINEGTVKWQQEKIAIDRSFFKENSRTYVWEHSPIEIKPFSL